MSTNIRRGFNLTLGFYLQIFLPLKKKKSAAAHIDWEACLFSEQTEHNVSHLRFERGLPSRLRSAIRCSLLCIPTVCRSLKERSYRIKFSHDTALLVSPAESRAGPRLCSRLPLSSGVATVFSILKRIKNQSSHAVPTAGAIHGKGIQIVASLGTVFDSQFKWTESRLKRGQQRIPLWQ